MPDWIIWVLIVFGLAWLTTPRRDLHDIHEQLEEIKGLLERIETHLAD